MITERFKVLGDLGVGATAEVKLVQDVKTNEKFACKVIKTGTNGINGQLLAMVEKEVSIMSSLSHEHIINTKTAGKGLYDKQDGSQP